MRFARPALESAMLRSSAMSWTMAPEYDAAASRSIGRHRKAMFVVRVVKSSYPPSCRAALYEFLTPEILEKGRPITFRRLGGRERLHAELLPVVCELYLKARDAARCKTAGACRPASGIWYAAGHVALLPWSMRQRYQEVRARDALSRILEAFIAKELQPWLGPSPMISTGNVSAEGPGLSTRPSSSSVFWHLTNDISTRDWPLACSRVEKRHRP